MTVHGIVVPRPEAGWPTGVQHLRIWDMGVTWRDVNPSMERWDWSRLDTIIAQANVAGVRNFTYTLGMTPQWAARDPNAHGAPWIGPGSSSPPWDLGLWTEYVTLVATRYRGVIGSYQVWNEPQLKEFWSPDGYAVLAEMTRLAYRAVKSVDPGAKVIAAPVLPRASSGGMKRAKKYLSALKSKGWPVDIWSAHFYPETDHTPGRWREYANEWTAALHALNAPKKPRWVTETNFNIFGPVLDATTVDSYMKRVDRIADETHIHKVYWYCWNHSDPNLFGIRFADGTQGARTLQHLSKGA